MAPTGAGLRGGFWNSVPGALASGSGTVSLIPHGRRAEPRETGGGGLSTGGAVGWGVRSRADSGLAHSAWGAESLVRTALKYSWISFSNQSFCYFILFCVQLCRGQRTACSRQFSLSMMRVRERW